MRRTLDWLYNGHDENACFRYFQSDINFIHPLFEIKPGRHASFQNRQFDFSFRQANYDYPELFPVNEVGYTQIKKNIQQEGKVKNGIVKSILFQTNGILHSDIDAEYPKRLDQQIQRKD